MIARKGRNEVIGQVESWNHRVVWTGLEGTFKDHLVQCSCHGGMSVPVSVQLNVFQNLSLEGVRAAVMLCCPIFDALGLWFCICVLWEVCWLVSVIGP